MMYAFVIAVACDALALRSYVCAARFKANGCTTSLEVLVDVRTCVPACDIYVYVRRYMALACRICRVFLVSLRNALRSDASNLLLRFTNNMTGLGWHAFLHHATYVACNNHIYVSVSAVGKPLPVWARAVPVAPPRTPARAIKGVMLQTWLDELDWADVVIFEADVVIAYLPVLWPRKRVAIVQVHNCLCTQHGTAIIIAWFIHIYVHSDIIARTHARARAQHTRRFFPGTHASEQAKPRE